MNELIVIYNFFLIIFSSCIDLKVSEKARYLSCNVILLVFMVLFVYIVLRIINVKLEVLNFESSLKKKSFLLVTGYTARFARTTTLEATASVERTVYII